MHVATSDQHRFALGLHKSIKRECRIHECLSYRFDRLFTRRPFVAFVRVSRCDGGNNPETRRYSEQCRAGGTRSLRRNGVELRSVSTECDSDRQCASRYDGGEERVVTGGVLQRRGRLYDVRGRADIAVRRLQRGGRRECDGGVSGAGEHQCAAGERYRIDIHGKRNRRHDQTSGVGFGDSQLICSFAVASDGECLAGAGAGRRAGELHADVRQSGRRGGGGELELSAAGGDDVRVSVEWRDEQRGDGDMVARDRGGGDGGTADGGGAGADDGGGGQSVGGGRGVAQSDHAGGAGACGVDDRGGQRDGDGAERAGGGDAGPGGPRATGAVRGDGVEHGDGNALGAGDGDGAGEHDGGEERAVAGGVLRRGGRLYDMRGRTDAAVRRLQRGGRRQRDAGVSGADQHHCAAGERHAAQLGRVGGGYVARQRVPSQCGGDRLEHGADRGACNGERVAGAGAGRRTGELHADVRQSGQHGGGGELELSAAGGDDVRVGIRWRDEQRRDGDLVAGERGGGDGGTADGGGAGADDGGGGQSVGGGRGVAQSDHPGGAGACGVDDRGGQRDGDGAERAGGGDAGPGGPRATGPVRGDGGEHGD